MIKKLFIGFVIILILVGAFLWFTGFFRPFRMSPNLDEEYCDSLRGSNSFCEGEFSVLSVRKFVCTNFLDYLEKDKCYYSLAIEKDKESLCEKIDYKPIRASCHKKLNSLQ